MKTLRRLAAAALMFSAIASGQTGIGQIKSVSGDVQLIRNGTRQAAKPGDYVEQQDTVVTGTDGSVGITFVDNTRISGGPDTTLALKRFRFDTTTHDGEFVTEVSGGTVAITSGQIAKHDEDAMKVLLPTSILGVRGTKFLVQVQ